MPANTGSRWKTGGQVGRDTAADKAARKKILTTIQMGFRWTKVNVYSLTSVNYASILNSPTIHDSRR
jgi:hypothetical protein